MNADAEGKSLPVLLGITRPKPRLARLWRLVGSPPPRAENQQEEGFLRPRGEVCTVLARKSRGNWRNWARMDKAKFTSDVLATAAGMAPASPKIEP